MDMHAADWDVRAVVGENLAFISTPHSAEPFSNHSNLCLDGKITHKSEYAVASGGSADVWTGLLGLQTVAIKVLRPFNSSGTRIENARLLKRLWREYLTWSGLSHPNVHACLGFSYDFTPQASEIPSLISPWMPNGSVLSYIENNPNVNRLALTVAIAEGLLYLHDRNPTIVHGDLRAGNVLVSGTGVPCLTDFGLSKVLSERRGMTTSSEVAGSLRWMAPELLRGEKVSEKSDVWAYGMTLLEILTGRRPYHEIERDPAVVYPIVDGQIPSRPSAHDGAVSALTEEIWGICRICWDSTPTRRPSMRQVKSALTAEPPMTLHPLLLPSSLTDPTPLDWDITLQPPPMSLFVVLGEPASSSAASSMRIVIPVPGVRDSHWTVHVPPSAGGMPFAEREGMPMTPSLPTQSIVRCADVLHALYTAVLGRATKQEYLSLDERRRESVSAAFWTRCGGVVPVSDSGGDDVDPAIGQAGGVNAEVGFGLLRFDLLEGNTRWEGLEAGVEDEWVVRLGRA